MEPIQEEILKLYSQAYPIMADCANSCAEIVENDNIDSEQKVTQITAQINLMREKYKNYCVENELFGLKKPQSE